MKYKKELNDFEAALSLNGTQVAKLRRSIEAAYNQSWHEEGPNVDQIYAFVAPVISTPEEAFYAASTILSDVFGAIQEAQNKNRPKHES